MADALIALGLLWLILVFGGVIVWCIIRERRIRRHEWTDRDDRAVRLWSTTDRE